MIAEPRGSAPNNRAHVAIPLLVFGLLFATDACAYLDPGTGSILLQGLIAATAAVVTWLSLSWQRIKAWMHVRSTGSGSGDKEAPR
jgi:hypothetical protein